MSENYHLEDDECMEAFLDAIMNQIEEEESGVSVLNIEKAKCVELSYRSLKPSIGGKGTTVTYELNAPFASMGSVSAVGKEIVVKNPRLLAAVARRAGSFEVYAKRSNVVEMDFTFHGLTKKIGECE